MNCRAVSKRLRSPASTMMVAAVILYFLGSGPVRGFAVSLGLGILTTVVTAVNYGLPGGMPALGQTGVVNATQMNNVAAYVYSVTHR